MRYGTAKTGYAAARSIGIIFVCMAVGCCILLGTLTDPMDSDEIENTSEVNDTPLDCNSIESSTPGDGTADPPTPLSPGVFKTIEVTAYCPCEKCCGQYSDGITASGRPAVGILCAADTKLYPFGTIMKVPGYGDAAVADIGGAIKGDRLDVLFATHEEALTWGRQILRVEVIR